MAETVRAMTHVINQGMAMYWGTSRWSSMEIMVAIPMAHQPVACGSLSSSLPEARFLVELSNGFHIYSSRLSLNEGVSCVLLGASSTEQLMENIGAIQVLPKLSSSITHEVDSILGNKPYSKKDYRS
uniref:Uncharacterized protein n=1 Tax=Sinocyclocheilus grahami TaxID=75366 RepID=A0A672LHI5_SINGR